MIGRIALDMQKDGNLERRLKTAVALARQHKAELVGVHTMRTTQKHVFDEIGIPEKVRKLLLETLEEEREAVKTLFHEAIDGAGIRAQWRSPTGDAHEALAMHARYADLLVMSQTDTRENTGSVLPSHTEAVIMSAGRPVLMVPYAGEPAAQLGKRVLVCWDGGRRAARALSDARPMLTEAKEIVVLSIDADPAIHQLYGIHSGDMKAYLTSQGLVEPVEVNKRRLDADVGSIILNTASDYGCDLIVMGAYSRNRVREWAFGGTSKSILQSMTVPILFSH